MSTLQDVMDLLRDMTGQSVVLSEAIARQAGLRPADLEVLGVIEQHGPLTAGRLGEATGLSPAAVTGLIDRLERAGVAERQADPSDRRRVLVGVSEGAARVAALYGDLEQASREIAARHSEADLTAIAEFLREMYALGVEHVARLDSSPPRRAR